MATFVCVKEKWLRKGYIYLVWIYLIRLGAWKGSNCSKRFTQSKQHAMFFTTGILLGCLNHIYT